jgi:hypothetical protein
VRDESEGCVTERGETAAAFAAYLDGALMAAL